MAELNENIEQWQNLLQQGDNQGAEDYYRNFIFDRVKQNFTAKWKKYRGKYQTIVSLVGFSVEPIILALAALAPQKVHFVVTPDSVVKIDQIIAYLGLKPHQFRLHDVNGSHNEEVYQIIKTIITKNNAHTVAVDITGGKKSMGSGAAQAAGYLGCDVFYVDYTQYMPKFRKPMPGTEFLNFLENPYHIFGDLEMDRIRLLYENGNYQAALELIGRLITKVPESGELIINKDIITAFNGWEEYQFKKAIHNFSKAQSDINHYRKLRHFLPAIEKKLSLLNKLNSNEDKTYLVLNHFVMSRKMAERNKYDFAVLLIYRTLEMALHTRLENQYHLVAGQPDYNLFPDLSGAYIKIASKLFNVSSEQVRLPKKIGMTDAAMILHILNDDIFASMNLEKLIQHNSNRNSGILAHGVQPNTSGQFSGMYKFFSQYIKSFLINSLGEEEFKLNVNEFDIIPI